MSAVPPTSKASPEKPGEHDPREDVEFLRREIGRGTVKAVVKLSGIDSFEDAEEIVGRAVYGDSSIYEDTPEESLEALVGWTVKDEDGVVLGEIVDYEDIPGNPCIWLETEDGQVMLPLHDDLIISADPSSLELVMSLPEGLV